MESGKQGLHLITSKTAAAAAAAAAQLALLSGMAAALCDESTAVPQADKALAPGGSAAGQVYFITNGTPCSFWGFVGDLLEPLGYGRPRIALPALLIYCLAWFYQYVVIPVVSSRSLKCTGAVSHWLDACASSCAQACLFDADREACCADSDRATLRVCADVPVCLCGSAKALLTFCLCHCS